MFKPGESHLLAESSRITASPMSHPAMDRAPEKNEHCHQENIIRSLGSAPEAKAETGFWCTVHCRSFLRGERRKQESRKKWRGLSLTPQRALGPVRTEHSGSSHGRQGNNSQWVIDWGLISSPGAGSPSG
jgi:hypothetical protein